MKKIFLILSAAAMLAACTTKQTYTINGHIEGDSMDLFNGIAILTSRDSENPTKDTVQIRENKFKFEGTIQTPVFHYISIPGISGVLPIFLENADYVITGHQDSLPKAKIEGGESQQLIKEYNNKIDEVSNRYNIRELIRDMRVPTTTEERKAEAESLYYACQEELSKYKDSMMKAHPLTHFYLNMFHNDMRDMELAEVIKIKDEFKADKRFKGNRTVEKIEEYIGREQALEIGKVAPEIVLPTPAGEEIKLSDIYSKNKITMIDFWAGWCGPCRNFNPTLVKIYNEYHDKGFEVYGVSLDKTKEKWEEAIKEDKLPWIHVSELKYWNGEYTKLYNVNYIPQNLFVDQEGKIIARKISEEEIETLLKERLN